jgi:hypothetical protein
MSNAPKKLADLQAFLKAKTGLRAVSLGIVGNAAHKSGYHLGEDRIFAPGGQGSKDYSVRQPRDKNALSNKASAIDIGSFNGLKKLSAFLLAEMTANHPETRDIREIIYSLDGKHVFRFDRNGKKPQPKERIPADSHRFHTHVSFYRDSENSDKIALFARFFGGAANPTVSLGSTGGTPGKKAGGEVVKSFAVPKEPSVCTIAKGVRLFKASDLKQVAFIIDPARDMPFLGQPMKNIALVQRTDEQGAPTGVALFARLADVKNIRKAPAAP